MVRRDEKVTEICLIAPSDRLLKKTRSIIKSTGEDIQVYKATLENAVEITRELMSRGARVFISRTGTQTLLERTLHATVVGIRTILSDYMEIMDQAKRKNGLVAFFSYDELSDDVKTMCRMLGINVSHYSFKSAVDAEEGVRKAIEDGVKLGVGGAVTEIAANKFGLEYLPLENSHESIVAAIKTAKQILQLQKEEEKKREVIETQLERFKAILNFTHDAIIAIDSEGKIDVVNPVAERILEKPSEDVIGEYILAEIPDTRMLQALHTGQHQLGQILNINKTKVYSNCIPIVVDQKLKGVVSTFQDIKSIQSSEQKIRIGLHEKGLFAKYHFEDIIGCSESVKSAKRLGESYAKANSTVLIYGETGTGKELFAQSIHNASSRKECPFVAINCATLNKELLKSELFGYVEGTFTGALKGGKAGIFEQAHTGTIFLDEIGEMPIDIQAILLRVLQEKEIRRLGGNTVIPVDVRVIAATNRDLKKEVEVKNFREDLYYRLNVLNIYIPPLRERSGDVWKIADYFFKKFSGSTYKENVDYFSEVMRQMEGYDWPGNVRELENFVEKIYVLMASNRESNYAKTLIDQVIDKMYLKHNESARDEVQKEDFEKDRIIASLKRNNYILNKTAKELGLSRTTLWRKLKQYGIG